MAEPAATCEIATPHAEAMALPTGTPVPAGAPPPSAIPYEHDPVLDHTPSAVVGRQSFVERFTGVHLDHVTRFSFDPATTRGNIESLTGVAQIPLGVAGPLRINGEHARGDFLIPLATTEGSLVASYNRGMKVLNLSGGVTCTIAEDHMQRAPVFVFNSARGARAFRDWVATHFDEIRRVAEATSHVAKLLEIESYLSNNLAFLRFDYATGDAAGQNMVGRATLFACEWIVRENPTVVRYYLESNFATDKKVSQINALHTRGKRVTAEVTIPGDILRQRLRVAPAQLRDHGLIANIGAFLSGATNNGLHAANALAAMFIATGQDVANVAEGSAAVVYGDVTPQDDLYFSITIPSLIVATHGGGTSLATQHECLAMLGCDGPGHVNKLAEIVAAVVLAGEISLAAAISANEWVAAHERFGRKR
jgi:hydroxymethylglutaryl-CoA reductase (NADPH)